MQATKLDAPHAALLKHQLSPYTPYRLNHRVKNPRKLNLVTSIHGMSFYLCPLLASGLLQLYIKQLILSSGLYNLWNKTEGILLPSQTANSSLV